MELHGGKSQRTFGDRVRHYTRSLKDPKATSALQQQVDDYQEKSSREWEEEKAKKAKERSDKHYYGKKKAHHYDQKEQSYEEPKGSKETETCAICGESASRDDIAIKGGWPVCRHHIVGVKASHYDSRCSSCLRPIQEGQVVLMCKHAGRWTILHPKEECGAEPTLNRSADSSGPYSVLYLTNNAPLEVVRAAYKALAMIHHPDKGGDVTVMQKINDALDSIAGN